MIQHLHKLLSRLCKNNNDKLKEKSIGKLVELEKDILYQEYANASEPEYLFTKGTIPILITAPHGAVHTRNGSKEEDEYTAGLARLLGERTGAHVLYARRKSNTDPNADTTAPFKNSLIQIVQNNNIRFVIDIHGANQDRDFGVAIGTMHGKSCSERNKEIIIGVFNKYGISPTGYDTSRLDVDNQLPGEGDNNREPIIRFCRNNTIAAAQIEINAKLRIPLRRIDSTHHGVPFSGDHVLIYNLILALSGVATSIAHR
mgnify:CR=1 FL=1